ncbi:MAG: enoyl-CoA hydratase/isomerase family protein, partial [Planctomycetes bacterium]|nr:enoyl-CoA hydratase/isomerase family protein [Planctomycetota bacterium]
MSEPIVLLDVKDRIATVTLNDPDRRNPITGNDMIDAMLEAFASVQRNPEVSVMILTGAGSAFCAGGDIKAMRDKTDQFGLPPLDVAESYINGIQRIPLAMY